MIEADSKAIWNLPFLYPYLNHRIFHLPYYHDFPLSIMIEADSKAIWNLPFFVSLSEPSHFSSTLLL